MFPKKPPLACLIRPEDVQFGLLCVRDRAEVRSFWEKSTSTRVMEEAIRSKNSEYSKSYLLRSIQAFFAPIVTLWKEATIGFRYLSTRRILLFVVLYVSLINFLIGGAFVLNTPYVLGITGHETTLGTLLSVMSAGGILGGHHHERLGWHAPAHPYHYAGYCCHWRLPCPVRDRA